MSERWRIDWGREKKDNMISTTTTTTKEGKRVLDVRFVCVGGWV